MQHMFMTNSTGLFQRAIAMSAAPWKLNTLPIATGFGDRFATVAGCTFAASDRQRACLFALSPAALANAVDKVCC